MKARLWYLVVVLIVLGASVLHSAPLSFKEALVKAEDHPKQQQYHTDTELSSARYLGAKLNFLPTVSIYRSWQGPYAGRMDVFQSHGWSSSLNLFRGGEDYHLLRRAYFNRDQQRSNERYEWLRTLNIVANLFVGCAYEKRRGTILKSSLDIRKKILDVATERLKRGVTSEEEHAKLSIDTTLVENNWQMAVTQYKNCLERVRFWIGDFEELDFDSLPELTNVKPEPFKIEAHPLWRSKQNARRQAEQNDQARISSFLPTLDLLHTHYPSTYFQPSGELYLLTLNWTLFDGGQRLIDRQISRLETQRSEEDFKLVERDLVTSYKTARENYVVSFEIWNRLQTNWDLSQKIVNSTLRRFRAGEASANDVAWDQTRLLDIRMALNDAWQQCFGAWLNLRLAQGLAPMEQ